MPNYIQVLINLAIAGVVLYVVIKGLSIGFDKITVKVVNLSNGTKKILFLALVGILFVLPFLTNAYFLRTAIIIGIYIVLALSLNFIVGFTGQLSMGHAAFYGIGAYTTALLTVNFGVSFWLALLFSALVAAAFGFLLGIPTLRLRGDYLAITTIGFGEIVRLVLVNWTSVTRGPAGIPGIPSPSIFGYTLSSNTANYYLILAIVAITIFVFYRILNSRVGSGLQAIREDEVAAEAMGIDTTKLKIMAFTIGAFFAGLAGSFFASYIHYVSPDSFTYLESVIILCMVVLGGIGSIPGVIVGAIVLAALPEALRSIATYRYAIYGMLLIMMMLMRPQGFISLESLKEGRKKSGDSNSKKRHQGFRGATSSK
ncbi:MAG: branched-chain amino acid ABC transporter permease [Bacillota bacterium]|nr:branched-chain amino acid ABC transporter permease [Bacillota bacterium]